MMLHQQVFLDSKISEEEDTGSVDSHELGGDQPPGLRDKVISVTSNRLLSSGVSNCDTHSSFGGNRSNEDAEMAPLLAAEESKRVFLSKLLLLAVMVLSAAAVGSATYWYTNRAENQAFKTQFEDYASELAKVSQINARILFDAYGSLSKTFTTSALDSNSTWPFVTIYQFEALTEHIIKQLRATFVSMQPLVGEHQRDEWAQYAVDHQDWVNTSLAYRGEEPTDFSAIPFIFAINYTSGGIYPDEGQFVDETFRYYSPAWHNAPVRRRENHINYNSLGEPSGLGLRSWKQTLELRAPFITGVVDLSDFGVENGHIPLSILTAPVFEKLGTEDKDRGNVVAQMHSHIPWHIFFENILSPDIQGIMLVLRNECGQVFSYKVNGQVLEYLGPEDFHDAKYDEFEVFENDTVWIAVRCDFSFHFYPTDEFEESFRTLEPVMFTIGVVLIFALTGSVFILYDCLVQKRQDTVMTSAVRTGAIVESFFPEHIRDQVMNEQIEPVQPSKEEVAKNKSLGLLPPGPTLIGKPIAEFHPACTVVIADIANFTAWSSVREPAQVFTLLETVYSAFDVIAKRRKVFKVETIGDSYVAVAGLPDARKDHAVVMARFAHSCRAKLNEVVHQLETTLGLGTSELGMRFGLHTGPITAGVLRGERSRFQLFGDTINTAARIESTGMKNQIQVSQQTADVLKAAGKGSWVVPRDGKVMAKGKGELQTYWLHIKSGSAMYKTSTNGDPTEQRSPLDYPRNTTPSSSKVERLISWHVDVLSRLLKHIVALRVKSSNTMVSVNDTSADKIGDLKITLEAEGRTVLDEVKEIITLPHKNKIKNHVHHNYYDTIELGPEVMKQLRHYVSSIASMYRSNSFHSFEHASHVAQSLTKLLSRVVAEDTVDYANMSYKKAEAEQLHRFTYGIASDPLTQFACAFSALIHDVDHRGVPNVRLVQEEPELAMLYKNKSVAEQNSVDISWGLLMEEEFKDLRATIYTNQDELDRFRQLVVNSVMATDIVDKELNQLRKNRWNKAFNIDSDSSCGGISLEDESEQDTINRKATIVIEHLIQAADVAHTMQHWHVYLKWNERFFHENYQAFLDGRLEKDPSIGWYQGEIGFFDFYIIPLARKLESCGVFGVSSDECLDYATANRNEWEMKGKEIIGKYKLRYK